MNETERLTSIDSVFSGFVLDPEKCRGLSLAEKRELVHEIAQWSRNAPEILSSFTRKELLEILCAEMGKERKYTGYTKCQMINHLLKLVCQKVSKVNTRTGSKRKWQREPPLQPVTSPNHSPDRNHHDSPMKVRVCQNVACQAALKPEEAFCNRCSCCICHQYDENKDPSLWLTCAADGISEKDFCGVSCHLRCALGDERASTVKIGGWTKLDGSYLCVFCGKINSIMRTWRKQLLIAKETRRVDALCLRISLGHKILLGTVKYKDVQKIVETALRVLEREVGPLNLLCTKMARGIVNRLSCGPEIQKLCASAVEAFDSMAFEHGCLDQNTDTTCLWTTHPLGRISVAAQGNDHGEENTIIHKINKTQIEESSSLDDVSKNTNERPRSAPPPTETDSLTSHASVSPPTPCKSVGTREATAAHAVGKKREEENEYEHSVRVVKWLEHDGHIDEDFRVKFLTWFSLKATRQQRKVVTVFVDAFVDDPPSLAGQLLHTFMDEISG